MRRDSIEVLKNQIAFAEDAGQRFLSNVTVEDGKRLLAAIEAGQALFALKDTGTANDLYRAWRELGAQNAFARGRIPLGSDADLAQSPIR
jgi:hypothetical protein